VNLELNSIPFKIVQLLKEKDKPLIAQHIAKGIKKSASLTHYHLQKLVKNGIVVIDVDFERTYYLLQPVFYMENAEDVLMGNLTPWVKEFMKQIEIDEANVEISKEDVLIGCLKFYFQLFLIEAKNILLNEKTDLEE
jgi:predicted transcriptional regulator